MLTEVWSWEGYSSSLKLWSGYLATPKIHFRTELNREHNKKKAPIQKLYIRQFTFSSLVRQFYNFYFLVLLVLNQGTYHSRPFLERDRSE